VKEETSIDRLVARRRHAQAWAGLALSLAAHVTDEALNDFLKVYNPTVVAIRERIPWLPLPVFTFDVWLTGLVIAVVLLLAVTPLVARGVRALVWLSYPLAILMLFNGIGHFAGTLIMGSPMPGVYSSPLLIGFSIWLFLCARRAAALYPSD
jgi:hypothetical protein